MQLQDQQKQKEFSRKFQDINRKMEEEQASASSFSFNLPYIDLSHFPIDLTALGIWTEEQAQANNAVIFSKEGNDIRVGTPDPRNVLLQQSLEQLKSAHKYNPKIYFISASSFSDAIKMYEKVSKVEPPHEDIVEVKSENDYVAALKR